MEASLMISRLSLTAATLVFSSVVLAEPAGMHVRPVSLMDPSGFQKPMESASSLLPADWTYEGGIIWRIHGECSRGYMMQWQAKSPDGLASITMYPTVGWRASTLQMPLPQDCMAGSFGSADS